MMLQWCRGGRCAGRNGRDAGGISIPSSAPVAGGWGSWSPFPDCASGCLHSDSGRLSTGSSGIQVSSRKCDQPRFAVFYYEGCDLLVFL